MNYCFDIQHAKDYGVDEAIMIYNFQFWIAKNKSNGKNLHDDRTWTYNTNEALAELFQFWKPHQIRRIIDNLLKKGVLLKGNYNDQGYDRTLWYAFKDEEAFLSEISVKSKKSNPQIHLRESSNHLSDINTDIKPNKSLSEKKWSDEVIGLTDGMISLLKKNYSKMKDPNIDKWRAEINNLIRIDGIDPVEIWHVIKFSQEDDFEKTNILSTSKLRKRYHALKLKMERAQRGTIRTKNSPTIETTVRAFHKAAADLQNEALR